MNKTNGFLDLSVFILQNQIAHGGFGYVYITVKKDNPDFKYVAKISKDILSHDDKKMLLMIRREVNFLAQLNHPYIVKFIGYSPIDFYHNPYPVIVTEYLPNGSLYSIIEKERENRNLESWDATKKLINIFGIASIMSYLHSKEIIHRDLKPQNILEDEYLFPKVADFGLSKFVSAGQSYETSSSDQCIKGTFKYLAPEIISDNNYSKASDVYAFALIVYEIITLQEPFESLNIFQTLKFVEKGKRPAFKNTVPKCYCDLIKKCWDQDPQKRPTFDQIVEILKKNKKFITLDVDEKQFSDYIELIENKGKDIDPSKKFQRITLSSSSQPKIIPKPEFSTIFNEIQNYSSYKKLKPDEKKFFETKLKEYDPKIHAFTISNKDSVLLYASNSLFSQDFISILNFFSTVIFELDSNKAFEDIFKQLSKIVDSGAKMIKIRLNLLPGYSGISNIISNKNVPISVTIDPSVTSIEKEAFNECSSLYEMVISSSVTKIGKISFYNCRSLKEIKIPESVKSIGSGAFIHCILLEKIELLCSLDVIESSTFMNCESLKKITIPSSVKSICSRAFADCSSLKEIQIPDSVEVIEEVAFLGCQSLNHFSIPPQIDIINKLTFFGCSSLTEIKIPSTVKSIEDDAFSSCKSLKNVTFEIPSSVAVLNKRAFSVCSSLEEISIPSSVKTFESFCFFGCIKLKKISIPSLKSFKESTFDGCISLESFIIPFPTSIIHKYAFNKCSSLKQITIPQSVNVIEKFAFNLCNSLLVIEIPSTVTNIEEYAFNGCSSLKKLVVPQSVIEIGKFAFRECIELNDLDFNASVSKIEDGLFEGCRSLESLTLPSSVTEIGKCAFQECNSLKTVVFSQNLTLIDDFAFCGCSSLLENLEFPRSIERIGKSAFYRCSSLSTVRIPRLSINRNEIGLDQNIKVKRFW